MTVPSQQRRCPVCDGANACALAAGGSIEQCWCRDATFDASLLARLAARGGQNRCLCARCANPATVVLPATEDAS